MDEPLPSNTASPTQAPREVPTAYCGLRTCGMHPEHLYTGDDGDAVRCPGGQQHRGPVERT